MGQIDINEKKWDIEILKILLLDNTTKQNIIWATSNYEHRGAEYSSHSPLEINLIIGANSDVIQPRALKSLENQILRTKDKAEVYTPSWMCNEQNNLIDSTWFGREDVFNVSYQKSWKSTTNKVIFPNESDKNWKNYIDEKRLEITCGEAPYLVSRYDTVTGKNIEISERIGQLDRKLRIVSENVDGEEEWLKWAERAIQAVYGFDFQGDSLLLARKNILATYVDYHREFLNKSPLKNNLKRIAEIISWNIWQMDGLTYTVPFSKTKERFEQLDFFSTANKEDINYSLIKDWRTNKIIEFRSLVKGVGIDG